MANRWLNQFFYSMNHAPVYIQGTANIGASGATSALTGSGISSVTRLAAGVYRVLLQDNYYRFLGAHVEFQAPVTGAAVSGGSFVSGTLYQIVTLGTTTQAQWVAAGLPSYLTAAPGMTFVATGVGAGTGTVQALGQSAVFKAEIVGNPQLTVNPVGSAGAAGASFILKCMDEAGDAVDPASGSVMFLEIFMRNSSIKGKGE